MQLTFPFADQDGPGPQIGLSLIELRGKFSDVTRRPRTIEEAKSLRLKVAQTIGLKPAGQNSEQQMPGEVRRRSPPEDCVPSGSKFPNIKTAQSRDLDVELLPIR
jgi:hypothetical protein